MIVDMEDTSVSDQSPPPASVTPLTTEIHKHTLFFSFLSLSLKLLNPLTKFLFSLTCFSCLI